jgi:predicted nucleotidyltransferase
MNNAELYKTFCSNLISKREQLLNRIVKVFDPIATEGHLFGSMARGDTDALSDIDIWLVFKDEDIDTVFNKRFEYYAQVGEIVHIVEPPQNAPIGGIQSAVLYKTRAGLCIVDYSLCPLSTAYIVKDNKKLFGDIDLSLGEAGLFNPQKVIVPESYRIDFFISFIFNGIKKIVRKDIDGFAHIIKEYNYLNDRYHINVPALINTEPQFDTLLQIINNIESFADQKQKDTLGEIKSFLIRVKAKYE